MTALHRIHELPCVIHSEVIGSPQTSRTVAHHLESVRDENSDYAAIAICDDCHRDLHGMSRRAFSMRYKLSDVDMLALTIKAMEKAGML